MNTAAGCATRCAHAVRVAIEGVKPVQPHSERGAEERWPLVESTRRTARGESCSCQPPSHTCTMSWRGVLRCAPCSSAHLPILSWSLPVERSLTWVHLARPDFLLRPRLSRPPPPLRRPATATTRLAAPYSPASTDPHTLGPTTRPAPLVPSPPPLLPPPSSPTRPRAALRHPAASPPKQLQQVRLCRGARDPPGAQGGAARRRRAPRRRHPQGPEVGERQGRHRGASSFPS